MFKVLEYLEQFSKIYGILCGYNNNICILPLSNDSFIYSFDNY